MADNGAGGLIHWLWVALAAYGVLVVAVYFYQSWLLYFPHVPTRQLEATPADLGLAYEDVTVQTQDGVQLHGWYVPPAQVTEASLTVLFFHGNAGNISHRLERLTLLHDLGLGVLMIDYRGYGRSEGHPSEHGTYRDAQAGWTYLTGQRGIDADRIIIFGHSLGGAVAAELASRYRPRALVVEASFISVPEVAADHYPWLPVRWLARFRYDVRASLGQVRSPVLIVHGRADEVIPFHHGEALFAAAQEPKQFLEIDGDHDRGFIVTGERYRRALQDFLQGLEP